MPVGKSHRLDEQPSIEVADLSADVPKTHPVIGPDVSFAPGHRVADAAVRPEVGPVLRVGVHRVGFPEVQRRPALGLEHRYEVLVGDHEDADVRVVAQGRVHLPPP